MFTPTPILLRPQSLQILLFPWLVLPLIVTGNLDYYVIVGLFGLLQTVINIFPCFRNDGYWVYYDYFELKPSLTNFPSILLMALSILGVFYPCYIIYTASSDIYHNMFIGSLGFFEQQLFIILREIFALTYCGFIVLIFSKLLRGENSKNV